MDQFWDEENLVGQVPKGRDVVQVRRCVKKQRCYIDIRTFWHDDADELRPGKGVALPVEVAEKVIELMREAVK